MDAISTKAVQKIKRYRPLNNGLGHIPIKPLACRDCHSSYYDSIVKYGRTVPILKCRLNYPDSFIKLSVCGLGVARLYPETLR